MPKLRKLDLSETKFSEAILKALLVSLSRETVHKLFLNNVALQACHASHLAAFIEEGSLKALHIQGNELGPVSLAAVLSAVHQK